MVKAIEHIEEHDKYVNDENFRIFPEAAGWYYPTYAYSKDAKYPVVIYEYSKYRSDFFDNPTRRQIKYCTMFIIIEAGFGFIFDDILYYPSKGDVFVIKNDESFATFMKEKAYDYYFEIDFPLSFFEHIKNDSMFSKLFYGEEAESPNIISTKESACNMLIQKIDELKKVMQSACENKDLVAWSYIIQIIDIIWGEKSHNKSYLYAKNLPAKLREAIEYININFVNLKSIDEIADYCHITATYLARMFKNILATTPTEYITNLKIEYAKHLLDQGKTLSDVCYESGFNNYTYFISKFKSITGTTPSKYQNR